MRRRGGEHVRVVLLLFSANALTDGLNPGVGPVIRKGACQPSLGADKLTPSGPVTHPFSYRSNAPISARGLPVPSPSRGRATPRWSVAGAAALSPLSMAGLPTSRACVLVGQPLLARGPSLGSMGASAVPTRSPLVPLANPVLPLPSPTRLWPPLVKAPDTSGPVPSRSTRFPAMMLF